MKGSHALARRQTGLLWGHLADWEPARWHWSVPARHFCGSYGRQNDKAWTFQSDCKTETPPFEELRGF